MSYVGTQPVPRATRVRTFGALATATNTIAIPGGFSPSNIEVFIDGLYVQPTDYNDLDGFNLVFITTLVIGTEYVVMEARTFESANHYTKQEIQDAAFDFNTMPTVGGNPIVESGSNSDGEWTKWSDGTQTCTYTGITITVAGSGAEGQFISSSYPVAFITAPVPMTVIAGVTDRGDTSAATGSGWRNFDVLSTTSTYPIYVIRNSAAVTATYRQIIFASGRWK
jgi:hypothetical protein